MKITFPRLYTQEKAGKTYWIVDCRKKGWNGQKTKGFTNEIDAKKYQKEVHLSLEKQGMDSVGIKTELLTNPNTSVLISTLKKYGNYTLEDSVEFFIKHLDQQRKIENTKTIDILASEWFKAKQDTSLTDLRQDTLNDLKHYSRTFAKDWAGIHVSAISGQDVEKIILAKNISKISKKNYVGRFTQFLNWCREKKYTDLDLKDIRLVINKIKIDKTEPVYLKVDIIEKVFQYIVENYQSCIGYWALAIWAGIRPKEIASKEKKHCLTWDNVNFETKEIKIDTSFSKVRKPRIIKMEDNLVTTLINLKQSGKQLSFTWMNSKNKKIRKKLSEKFGIEWKQDILRHTYATYAYSKHHDLEELRYIMGNSPKIIEDHYKAVISDGDTARFWGISYTLPKTDGKPLFTIPCPSTS